MSGDIMLSISQTSAGFTFVTRFAAIDHEGEVTYVEGMTNLPTEVLPAEKATGPLEGAVFALHYNIEPVSYPLLVSRRKPY